MADNQQAKDFFPRLFSDGEAKIVGGLTYISEWV
jgi:hypothetical protein